MSRALIYGGPSFVAGALLWAVATVSLWTVPLTVILWWAMWAATRIEKTADPTKRLNDEHQPRG